MINVNNFLDDLTDTSIEAPSPLFSIGHTGHSVQVIEHELPAVNHIKKVYRLGH